MSNTSLIGVSEQASAEAILSLRNYHANAPATLKALRAKVPDELRNYVLRSKGPFPWNVLQHPLAYAVPFFGGDGEIEMLMGLIARKKQRIAEKDSAGEPWYSVWQFERPWRLSAFVDRMNDWPKDKTDDFYETLGNLWTDSENIHQGFPVWSLLMQQAADTGNQEKLMDEKDLTLFRSLTEKESVTVWRGAVPRQNVRGLSWTVDRDRAAWFARRFDGARKNGAVFETTIRPKQHLIATFTGRNESEAVLSPAYVKQAKIRRL